MSASNAVITVANTQLSPMRVKFNGVDLGTTNGGVEVTPKYEYADIMADQLGKTVLDKRVSGYAINVKFSLGEVLNKDNWKIAFPSIKEVGSGPKAIYADMQIGDSLIAHASPLLLHPLDHLDSDLSADFLFYKAACASAPTLKYTPDKQVELAVDMIVFPDTSVSPARWFTYGDPSIGLVAASAGAPSFTGTGNGTLTSVAVTSGVTKTETISATCVGVGAASATVFFVSGSLSGPLGEFAVAHASTSTFNFTSSITGLINFTITQGATAFVVGDQFQVVTTAANFA